MNTTALCVNGCSRADGVPYLAQHGNYCNRCWARIDVPLAVAGELTLHLLGHAITGVGAGEERVDASKDAPLPFNQAAFDDVNDLYGSLVHWATVWAEHLNQPTPTAAKVAWRTERGTPVGLPANTSPAAGARMVLDLTAWLRERIDDILITTHTDDIQGLNDSVTNIWRMNAAWPRVERADYSTVPCRIDGCNRKIAVYPPAFPGDARRIVCTGGHWYPEDEYEHLILVFQEEAKERKKTDRIAARLAKRFGIGAASSA